MFYPYDNCKSKYGLQSADSFGQTNPKIGTIIVMTWGGPNYFAEVRHGERCEHRGENVIRLISTVNKSIDYLTPEKKGKYDYGMGGGWCVVHVFPGRCKVGVFKS